MGSLLLLVPHFAAAQSPPKQQPNDYALLTYDVRDLVLNVPDYPYPFGGGAIGAGVQTGGLAGGGGFGGGGGLGAFGGVRTTQGGGGARLSVSLDRLTMEALQTALQNVVAPGSWELEGGEGRVQQLGRSLVVWQAREVHAQIANLLKQLREGSGERKTVMIDARWLLLDSDDLMRLMPPDQAGNKRIDRKLLEDFTRRPTSIRGITNCFSGQLVYLVSGTRRSIVSSYIPVVGSIDKHDADKHDADERLVSLTGGAVRFVSQNVSGSDVGYRPIVETLNFGALLEIRPTLTRDKDVAIVDLKSTLTVLGQEPGSFGPPPAVDRIAIETQELATTLRVPLGQPVLVGGLTYAPPSVTLIRDQARGNSAQQDATTAENRQLYLLLELR